MHASAPATARCSSAPAGQPASVVQDEPLGDPRAAAAAALAAEAAAAEGPAAAAAAVAAARTARQAARKADATSLRICVGQARQWVSVMACCCEALVPGVVDKFKPPDQQCA